MPETDLVAREGEIVTCQNGHEIARIKSDLMPFMRVCAAAFEPLRGGLGFTPGARIEPCPECGGRYIRKNGGGLQLHVGREWRKATA